MFWRTDKTEIMTRTTCENDMSISLKYWPTQLRLLHKLIIKKKVPRCSLCGVH